MKFNAGEKFNRTNNWTRVKVTIKESIHYTRDRNEKREWCKAQESDASFYYHYASRYWWFEEEKDAFFFSLKWGTS